MIASDPRGIQHYGIEPYLFYNVNSGCAWPPAPTQSTGYFQSKDSTRKQMGLAATSC